ncbi:hypothetical protein R2601_26816 [Salipiger bermudensis HTCC2601]|uniref:Uncharacterized protein n=1 Tax=Salipiger bermudensis (strain DSM 26914 / JCM 13377 / KCTC 12554 / HTCC2601) TaxID=314265 RepID=Q0FPA4_SALBH|nr:hypothetical protein R2601_26816 [Salipiger bermudensis HTCC2601]
MNFTLVKLIQNVIMEFENMMVRRVLMCF